MRAWWRRPARNPVAVSSSISKAVSRARWSVRLMPTARSERSMLVSRPHPITENKHWRHRIHELAARRRDSRNGIQIGREGEGIMVVHKNGLRIFLLASGLIGITILTAPVAFAATVIVVNKNAA